MIHERSRTPARFVALGATIAATLVGATTQAGPALAQSITQTRQEIANLSAQLSYQEKQSEITANAYDTDKARVATLAASELTLQHHAVTIRAHIATTTKALVKASVISYVTGASAAQTEALFTQNANQAAANQVYSNVVLGDLNTLRNSLNEERHNLFVTIRRVDSARRQATAATNEMQALLSQNITSANSTRSTLAAVTVKLKGQIIAFEVAAGAAAARSGNLQAESSAVAAAAAVGGQSAANQVTQAIQAATPPAVTPSVSGSAAGSAAGLAAVHWAETQIGVPYVWGGETSGLGFDCSGLVQWAWAKAGYSIPRTTETQWAALPHIPLSQLRPGDLLYYYNLDGDNLVDHVTMYTGSGPWGLQTTIAAAHTGTNISLAPLFTFGLIGAARP
jgi:cell wall-associated NlpC family hydrolase